MSAYCSGVIDRKNIPLILSSEKEIFTDAFLKIPSSATSLSSNHQEYQIKKRYEKTENWKRNHVVMIHENLKLARWKNEIGCFLFLKLHNAIG